MVGKVILIRDWEMDFLSLKLPTYGELQ
jgi:hypothetical protein